MEVVKNNFKFGQLSLLSQGTMAPWSNSSSIRSGDPRFESRRGSPEFFILLNRREETQKDDAEDIESSRIGSR